MKVSKMKPEISIDVQDIDHLGIIAGIIDDIGIVEIIGEHHKKDDPMIIAVWQIFPQTIF
jgi:hypothetical protein